jgi:putative ABC transport system permease protein
LTVVEIALGVGGVIALRQLVASQLYGVSGLDLPVFLLAVPALFLVAAFACFIPARRATRSDPAELLRAE